MTRAEIISSLKQFFSVKELVCPHTFAKHGENSWTFLDTDLLHCLLVIRRDILKVPLLVNNGTTLTQRGLRCNLCDLVRNKTTNYLSAHIFGKGVDFSSSSFSAEQMRKMIEANAHLLPCNIRLEKDVNWVHLDVMYQDQKVFYFKG